MPDLRTFPDLSPRAYEHPAGRASLAAARRGPAVARRLVDAVGARRIRTLYLSGALRIDDRQLPEVWDVFCQCAEILDVPPPELYVSRDASGHLGALGTEPPFVVLSAATLKLFQDDAPALRFLLGRELGHVLSGHALYNSALGLLMRTRTAAASVPMLGLAVGGAAALLKETLDKSAFSADRAGLLCAQDVEACERFFVTMAGGEWDLVDPAAFRSQEVEYEASRSVLDTVLKLVDPQTAESPQYVLRFAELERWVESGAYERILDGDFPRRSDDPGTTFGQEARVTFQHYAAWLGQRRATLAGLLRRGPSATEPP